jgi:hypothetical protein
MTHRLHLHSQNREAGTSAVDASFVLSKTINNVRSIAVKHCVVANECHNIMAGLNALHVSVYSTATTVSIPPLFYTLDTLATAINDLFQLFGSGTYVTVNGTVFDWILPIGMSITGGTAGPYVGINTILSGSFSSSPYLGAPHSIGFVCPQIDTVQNVVGGQDNGNRPFFILPLVNGFGQHEVYVPHQLFSILCSNTVLDQVRIRLIDPATGIPVHVLHWSIEMQIETY